MVIESVAVEVAAGFVKSPITNFTAVAAETAVVKALIDIYLIPVSKEQACTWLPTLIVT